MFGNAASGHLYRVVPMPHRPATIRGFVRSQLTTNNRRQITDMFDQLTDKFSGVFRSLSGRGRISEENIHESMREVRTALLEADVNFQVVNDFTDQVIQKALGT